MGNTDGKKFIKSWRKQRQKGKGWYVLTRSIILGLTMLVAFTISNFIKDGKVHFDFIYFIGGFLGAMIGTSFRWNANEIKYNQLINNRY